MSFHPYEPTAEQMDQELEDTYDFRAKVIELLTEIRDFLLATDDPPDAEGRGR